MNGERTLESELITETNPTPDGQPKIGKAGMFAGAGLLLIAGAGLAPRVRQGRELASEVRALRDSPPEVTVATASWGPAAAATTLPANIQAIEQTTLQARTSGYLSRRFVDIGSHVTKGQLLAIVESPEVDQQVSQSQADVARADAGMGQAVADASKSRATVSAARSEWSRSEAAVLQAKADLAHLKAKKTQAQAAVRMATAKVSEEEQLLAGAKADLNRARVDELLALKTRDRWRQLEKANAVSGQEVDEKETDYDASAARVEAAKAVVSSTSADGDAAKESLESAKADVEAAQADVDSGVQRVTAAQSEVQTSQADVVAAQSSLAASRSNVDAARASVGATQAGLRRVATLKSFEKIVAPFDGIITARNVDVGDLINPSTGALGDSGPNNAVSKTGLFGLARTNVLCAMINVPEDEIGSIRQDQQVEIAVQELPGKRFYGTVFHISGALDAYSRTLLVEVRIPNDGGTLKPGMYGQARFMGVAGRRAIRIPANSLIFDARGTRVATVGPDGTLHFVPVKVALDLGDYLEVTGLRGTESVVTNPDNSLAEGIRVTVHREGGSQ